MTAPIPAAVGPAAQIAAATPQHRDGAAFDPGALLRRLVVGSQHSGLVVGSTPDGRPQVSIDSALLTLDGVAPLPAGTRVAIRITATAPALAIELTVRGDGGAKPAAAGVGSGPGLVGAVPLASAEAVGGLAAVPRISPAGAAASPPTVTLLTQMTWQSGTAADDPHAVVAPWPKTLPPGTQLPVRVSLAPEGMAEASPAALPRAAPLPTLAPNAQLPVRVSLAPEGMAGASAATLPRVAPLPTLTPGTSLEAVVSAVLPDGRAIVTLPAGGAFVLSKTAGLAPGTRLALVLGDAPTPAWPQQPAAAGAAPLAPWRSLQALAEGLDGETQAHARALLNAALPRPDAHLGERLHALLAAARAADPRELLGDEAVEHLARQRPELLAGIARDLERTAAATDAAPERQAGDGWTAVDLPLLVGTAVEPLRLLLRHRPPRRQGADGDGDAGDGHFVVEVTLRLLGRVQLDTMVRAGTPAMEGLPGLATRLDMMVRSERPLDATARQDIRELACSAGERTGVRVGVGFQAGPPGFVDVPSQRPAGAAGDLIV